MRNLKKILALVLSLMMVLSVMVTASATDFADDADITNKEAVEVMSALGILSGSQGKFAPQALLSALRPPRSSPSSSSAPTPTLC